MSFAYALACRECGREYGLEPIFSCDFCFGPLEVNYRYEDIREAMSVAGVEAGPNSLWRYSPLLPCAPEYKVDLGAGFNPLINFVLNPCDCPRVKCIRVFKGTAQLNAFWE